MDFDGIGEGPRFCNSVLDAESVIVYDMIAKVCEVETMLEQDGFIVH